MSVRDQGRLIRGVLTALALEAALVAAVYLLWRIP